MATAILYGASAGALHAVTGPDHVLSLGPVVLHDSRRATRVGILWGLGHALGTLLLALPLLLIGHYVALERIAAYGDRLAGLALIIVAAWSAWAGQRSHADPTLAPRSPLWVGLLHGVTGAGSVLLMLPALVGGDEVRSSLFLLAFSVGSTFAMGALTMLIGRVGAKLQGPRVRRAQLALTAGSAGLGAFWLLGG